MNLSTKIFKITIILSLIFMSITVWGLLEKSQTDAEKIEEAIARLITEHNANEEAHLGAGQSLQSHKAATIIDHVVASIIADKIKDKEVGVLKFGFDREWVQPNFESKDAWAQATLGANALIQFLVGNAYLRPGDAVNDYARIGIFNDLYAGTISSAKDPFFQVMLQQIITGKTDWGVVCGYNLPLGTPETAGSKCFGFQYILADNKVYAFYVKGVAQKVSVEMTGVDISQRNVFRAEMTESGTIIKFYVNGVLKHTASDMTGMSQNYYLYVESKRQVTLLSPCLLINNIVISQKW